MAGVECTGVANHRPQFDCPVWLSFGKKSTLIKDRNKVWFYLNVNKKVVCSDKVLVAKFEVIAPFVLKALRHCVLAFCP